MLKLNGNLVTLADFGLLTAARPVLYREREIARKRRVRALAQAQRAAQEKLAANCARARAIREARESERKNTLAIVLRDGRVVRPIK